LYLDPVLKSHYESINKEHKSDKIQPYDLFKTDLYSLGLTFYQIITG